MAKSYRRAANRYRPYASAFRNIGSTALNYGMKYLSGRSLTQTTRRNNVQSGQGVTNQYDRKVVYRKKYMPRRKKRAWKQFTRKVVAVNTKLLGSRTVLFNNSMVALASGGNQAFMACTLYGMDGGVGSNIAQGQDDIKRLLANDVDQFNATDSFIFASAIMDLTLVNDTLVNPETQVFQNSGLEVDVYEFKYSRIGDANWPGGFFAQAALNTATINSGSSPVDLAQRGATPWDLPDALALGGIKILKKTKYFLSKGQTATYQMRDAGNHYITRSTVDNTDNNFINTKMTRSVFIIFKGVPTQDPVAVSSQLRVGCTRKYLYKVMSKSGKADNYNP